MVFMPYTDLNALVQTWVQAGIMSVLVVFVLVFAIVFAILQKSKILGAKAGIDAVIALALALGSLQFNWMTNAFYTKFFANMGVGLIVMIGALIFVGLIAKEGEAKPWNVLIAVAGFIIFLVVLIKSAGSAWWGASAFWSMYGGYIIVGLFLVGIILAVILLGKNKAP